LAYHFLAFTHQYSMSLKSTPCIINLRWKSLSVGNVWKKSMCEEGKWWTILT
jgi:hypothetical protein